MLLLFLLLKVASVVGYKVFIVVVVVAFVVVAAVTNKGTLQVK